ncbi:MAG: electron transfer flavoprotein subunit alpha/FixB family protein [Chloroflexota bacterium]
MAEYQGVMVFGEVEGDHLARITTELLGCGRKLADDLGQPLCAVLVGSGVSPAGQAAISFGADQAYLVDDPLLKGYAADACVLAMEKVASQVKPRILILGQTDIGRDLAPRLAFRWHTAAVLDCVELAIDPASKLLLETKPVYGGNAQAVYVCESYPQIATVRAKVMSPLQRDDSRKGEIITVEAGLDPQAIRARVVKRVTEAVEGVRLEDAKIVVAGGRGLGGADAFKPLEELARLLKGAVGASRPPCDNGWLPDTRQIGLTGKMVTPDLYLAVAISGASQHLSGCSGAKAIVAINKDAEANIFRVARFGVIADWKKVLPAFTAKVKELLAG